jgi:pimeloyl-ACP methyl ester carboxylesterase
MIRTGGGGDRPLVDRGPRAEPGGGAIAPGTGPALLFARAGWAGVSVDGPHGGLRNITHADEQFLIFNFANPVAMRDNLRQSALEIALLPDVLASLSLDVSDCPPPPSGLGPGASASFDPERLALMGHSMGATIAPLTLAVEPRYRAAILSGAGGSWIENVIYKESPLPVKPLAEILIGYPPRGLELTEHDPFLNLLQWAGESADPPVYAWRLVHDAPSEPIHVLMFQGIVDTYILPPIANSTSLSLGLDLAGDSLDAEEPRLSDFRPLQELLPYRGRQSVTLPVSANVGTTAVVVQHLEDGIEDGHEVMFQKDGARHQVLCFLKSYLAGTPAVVPAAGALDPCP